MNSTWIEQSPKTKVSEVPSANRGDNMKAGKCGCLGERQ